MDKESWRREGDPRPDPRGETSFDELAKGLANGTISRRQALRWMGGALVGGVLASIPGVALAQAGGNSACDEFCHANFSGREAGKCTSAGAHGTGPCYTCTPGIGPGPNFVPPECPAGAEFNPTTCQCEFQCGPGVDCASGTFTICGEETGQFCTCIDRLEGGTVCGQTFCGPPCTSSDECAQLLGPGAVCQAPDTGCCGQTCIALCGTESAAAATSTGESNVPSS
jgi:hypothetical protein